MYRFSFSISKFTNWSFELEDLGEILTLTHDIQSLRIPVKLVCGPARVGVQGNELADKYATWALKADMVGGRNKVYL